MSLFQNLKTFFQKNSNQSGQSETPTVTEPVQSETEVFNPKEESLNSKLHRDYFESHNLAALYSGRISGIIKHYFDLSQNDSKLDIHKQIKTDLDKITNNTKQSKELFVELQNKLKQNMDITNPTKSAILVSLRSICGINVN